MKKKELIELHDIVANHPFRKSFNTKYYRGYHNAINNLADAFNNYIKPIVLHGFIHDYIGAAFGIGYSINKPKDEKVFGISFNDYNEHLERCLGVIHRYLISGEIPFYWTFYGGCNILESMNRLTKYVLKDGEYHPEFTKKELEDSLKEIDNYYVKNKREKWEEFSMYSEYFYNYLKEELKKKK